MSNKRNTILNYIGGGNDKRAFFKYINIGVHA